MPAERSIDALKKDEQRLVAMIEEDLDRLLAVEPSPEFAAKVRARIGAEERAGTWSLRWGWAFAAAVIALAVVIGMTAHLRRTVDGDSPFVARGATARDVPLPAAPAGPPVAVSSSTPAHAARPIVVKHPPAEEAAEPEVLVPADQRAAIAQLLEMARAGTLDARVFPARSSNAVDADAMPPVAPMVIEELKVPLIGVDGGVEKENDSKSTRSTNEGVQQ